MAMSESTSPITIKGRPRIITTLRIVPPGNCYHEEIRVEPEVIDDLCYLLRIQIGKKAMPVLVLIIRHTRNITFVI